MTIEQKYQEKCATHSDINENLPILKKYASECEHVTEMGVRSIVSTWALLAAKPKRAVSIDLIHPSMYGGNLEEVEELTKAEGIDFSFIEGNTLKIDIEQTDFLFIDTLHSYIHLISELRRFNKKVNKYIALHDTETFAFRDEDGIVIDDSRMDEVNKMLNIEKSGLWNAVIDFLNECPEWEIAEKATNNNGMTVLKRKI
jgi:hypothetical protein